MKKSSPELQRESAEIPNKKKTLLLSLCLIAVLGWGVYQNSLQGDFLWDDEGLVKYNVYTKDWGYLPDIFLGNLKAAKGEVTNFYRPVQSLMYLIEHTFWKLNVTGYHLTNVFLHILVAWGIYWLVRLLFQNNLLSLLTALFFVAHPIHTEAVAYISGLADPLAAVFLLLCLILYIKNLERPQAAVLFLIALCFALAVLSRESSLILPLLLLFYHAVFRKPVPKAPLFLLSSMVVAYVVWRGTIFQSFLPRDSIYPPLLERIPGSFVAITHYLKLLWAPFPLHMEYGAITFSPADVRALVGLFLTVVLLLYAIMRRKQDPISCFSIGWFFIALLPSMNLYPINAYMAEHWLYLPSVGFFLILARILTTLLGGKRFKYPALLATAGFLIFFSFLTVRQNEVWSHPVTLFRQMVKHAPHSSKLYNNLAKAYYEAGRHDELIGLLQKAIEIDPTNTEAINNLGNAYKNVGRYDEALHCYQKAMEIDPDFAGGHYNLALLYADVMNRKEEAISLLEKAIEINPYEYAPHHKLGLIYFREGKVDEAIASLKRALTFYPGHAAIYHALGYVYFQTERFGEAKAAYKKAVEMDPQHAKALHDLAVIYVAENKFKLAIEYCDRAAALGYKDPALSEALEPHR